MRMVLMMVTMLTMVTMRHTATLSSSLGVAPCAAAAAGRHAHLRGRHRELPRGDEVRADEVRADEVRGDEVLRHA